MLFPGRDSGGLEELWPCSEQMPASQAAALNPTSLSSKAAAISLFGSNLPTSSES